MLNTKVIIHEKKKKRKQFENLEILKSMTNQRNITQDIANDADNEREKGNLTSINH